MLVGNFFFFFPWEQFFRDDDELVLAGFRLDPSVYEQNMPKIEKKRAALIFYGGRFESLLQTGESTKRYVVDYLDMDVYICGGGHKKTEGFVKKLFGSRLKYVHLGPQLFDDPSAKERMQKWPGYEFYSTKCGSDNLFFHPGTINAFHSLQGGYDALREYEGKNGFKYDYVLFSRPDMEWLIYFPPFDFFKSNTLYFPTRTSWGGLPGGMAFCQRDSCDHFGDFFNRLESGHIWNAVFKGRSFSTSTPCGKFAEGFVYVVIQSLFHFDWFSNVANIVCFNKTCTDSDLCTVPIVQCKPGQRWKYQPRKFWDETYIAQLNAERISQLGWKQDDFTYRMGHVASYVKERALAVKEGKAAPLFYYNAEHPQPPWVKALLPDSWK